MEKYYDPFNKFEDMKTKFCKYYARAIPYLANFKARHFGDLNDPNSNWQKLVFLISDLGTNGGITNDQ
ncbi:MAG: hypothetical protein ACE5KT_06390 [Methanosarcinales archaeon]